MAELNEMQRNIAEVCYEIKDFLIQKNQAYGNSASDPVRVFSKASPMEQLNVRIDDKLSRIARGDSNAKAEVTEDTELDLIGSATSRATTSPRAP